MSAREGNSFVLRLNVEGNLRFEGKQNSLFPEETDIRCFVI